MSRYFKLNRYIFEIELTENSKPIKLAENRNDIIDENNAKYDTNEFKIINIIDMETNEKVNSYGKYTINNIYKEDILYFKSFDRAFLDEFHKNRNYLDFKNGYSGIIKHYHIDGHLLAEFYIVNDKKNGLCKKYYTVYNGTDRLQEGKHYINGKINGLCREYDNKGNLIKESNYVDHKLNGLCSEYDNKGNILKEYNYLNEKLDGLYKEFNKNEILLKECNYVNGKLHGVHKEYNQYGYLIKECNYVNDIKQGIITEYDVRTVKIEFWKHEYGYYGKEIPQEKMNKIRDYINTILSE
jgi:antitoxin component YwqK of YwqJK toxin-antitoxin module